MQKKNKIIAKNSGENDDEEEDSDYTAKIQNNFPTALSLFLSPLSSLTRKSILAAP